jgi:CSN8/PSMD8/EIF3K family
MSRAHELRQVTYAAREAACGRGSSGRLHQQHRRLKVATGFSTDDVVLMRCWHGSRIACVQAYPAFQEAARVVKLFWNREYAPLWPLLSAPNWPEPVRPMVVALRTVLRQHIAELISNAYSTVTVATATALLGSTRDELLSGARSAGAQCCVNCLIVHGRMCSHDTALALWIGTWHLILARVQIYLHVVSQYVHYRSQSVMHCTGCSTSREMS